MLRLHVVRAEGVGYYLTDLVPGRAEGSGVAGESPGEWSGRGSAALGLRGAVRAPDLAGVLDGRDPTGGPALRQARGARPVSGFDLVFAAPKAVSLLHLLAPRELAAAAGSAHGAAVADAVGYLESAGLGVRRTRDGDVARLATTGGVAAGFVHRTSRTLDPHLHTHLVVANVAQGVDGRWSALDSRRLFLHRRATQAVYGASLRHALGRSAGVAFERTPSGTWDAVGVDPVLCRLFSQRAASIDEATFRTAGGVGSPGVRRVAYFADRPAKDRQVTVDELRTGWARRAASMGIDTAELVRVVGRAPPRGPADRISGQDVVDGLDRLAATRTTLTTRDLVTVVADAAPHGLVGGEVMGVAGSLEAAARGDGRGRGRHEVGGTPAAFDRALRDDPTLVERALAGRSMHPASRKGPSVDTLRRSGREVRDGSVAGSGLWTGLGR